MNVSLVMFTAEGDRRDFSVTKPRTVIGRQNDCALRIPLASVSRQHCEIRVEDGKAVLRDLGSSNGTYHNNSRVEEASLSAGDEVVIGPVIFTVVIDGYPTDVSPVRSILSKTSDEAAAASAGEPAGEAASRGEPAAAGGGSVSAGLSGTDVDAEAAPEDADEDIYAALASDTGHGEVEGGDTPAPSDASDAEPGEDEEHAAGERRRGDT